MSATRHQETESRPLKLNLGWNQFQTDMVSLCVTLEGRERIKGIIGVARGGLVPATFIANHLKVEKVKSIQVASYRDGTKKGLVISSIPSNLDIGMGRDWLVVDDISDTGDTFATLRKYWPEAYYVAPYIKPKGSRVTDHFEVMIDQDQWLIMPWEVNPYV